MNLFILSDLHIFDEGDPLYLALLQFLKQRPVLGDVVVFAGDVFDLLVGSKPIFQKKYRLFFHALSEAERRGVKIHYIEGNHDFLLERAFDLIPSLQVHPQEVSLELGGRKFLIIHGDTVDRSDYGYRAIRAFFRSPVMKGLVTVMPGEWLEKIGQASSRYSRSQKPGLFSELPLERRERLRCVYRSFAAQKIVNGYDFVAMGHCHDLDEMSFTFGDTEGQYINVGFPRVHRSILSWTLGDQKIHREPLC